MHIVSSHGGMRGRSPNPSPVGSWELPKSEERKKIGGGVEGVPVHLGQTNYAEICILVTEYITTGVKVGWN